MEEEKENLGLNPGSKPGQLSEVSEVWLISRASVTAELQPSMSDTQQNDPKIQEDREGNPGMQPALLQQLAHTITSPCNAVH